jgi:hypothetical protein
MSKQLLIVEGKDAIVLSVLLGQKGIGNPKGYENKAKREKEFIKNGEGYQGAISAFREAVESQDYSNIGIIIDANDKGAASRWKEIRHILTKQYDTSELLKADAQKNGKLISQTDASTIGIWIMPDNENEGYLEHFISELVPPKDENWQHVEVVMADLQKQKYCKLTKSKIGKAKLHTWLAWQKEPGKPFGTAMQAEYFDVNAPIVQPFLDWFSATFVLA